ncbi:nuclear transport factor 2 family protein [Nocardiopsis tropica]|jgi:ketosteroid isomerase-like protein|uniref:Nuclear transport factor 2 family protein n=1 Tax=Nocardiopsis tropica TaxID=109330 RepID=A0ABU7KUZ7_9ACTN|nr:nuclear transport factor 2 family protein [Nocardiopsis umidischolae]MEE2052497.1 nuclear transport factor 2 family protein [Nocardiopsis umidischolae]
MATDTQTSRTVAEKFVERLGRQDPDGIQELFAQEIDWHVPGSDAFSWTGRRTRREQVAPYFTTMWPHFAHGRSKVALEHVIVDGGDAVLLATWTHTVVATGKEFTTPAAIHLRVEDDRIVRMHLYEDTLTVDKAFDAD